MGRWQKSVHYDSALKTQLSTSEWYVCSQWLVHMKTVINKISYPQSNMNVFNDSHPHTLIARFMGPTWGPSGTDRTQVSPMFVTWTLWSGSMHWHYARKNSKEKVMFIVFNCVYSSARLNVLMWTNGPWLMHWDILPNFDISISNLLK